MKIWSSAHDGYDRLLVKQPLRRNGHGNASPLLLENSSPRLNQEHAGIVWKLGMDGPGEARIAKNPADGVLLRDYCRQVFHALVKSLNVFQKFDNERR